MATKRKEDAAEAVNTTTELEKEQETQPEPSEAGPAGEEEGVERAEPEQVTLVYIGPSLPYGKMRSSMILNGTEEEIDGFLAKIKEQYPEVTHLLVPPDRLTDALEKVARKGTILHKYYEDMLAKSRASRKG